MCRQASGDITVDEIAAEAAARHAAHQNHPSHRPLTENYELIGLRGEQAFAEMFGLDMDLSRRPGGDKGVDFVVTMIVKKPLILQYKVDVKSARRPFNLIVEKGKVDPKTIYVLGHYMEVIDRVKPIGWEWGAALLQAPTATFGHGQTVLNHYIPRERLRPMSELQDRIITPG
jgi:hypothetical protein